MHLHTLKRIKKVQEIYKKEKKNDPTANEFLQILAIEHSIFICRATLYSYLTEKDLNSRIAAAELTAAKEMKAAREVKAVKRRIKKQAR